MHRRSQSTPNAHAGSKADTIVHAAPGNVSFISLLPHALPFTSEWARTLEIHIKHASSKADTIVHAAAGN